MSDLNTSTVHIDSEGKYHAYTILDKTDKMPFDLLSYIMNDIRINYDYRKLKYDSMSFSADINLNPEQQGKLKTLCDLKFIELSLYSLLHCPCICKITYKSEDSQEITKIDIDCITKESSDITLSNIWNLYLNFERQFAEPINNNQDIYQIITEMLLNLPSEFVSGYINSLGFKGVKGLYAYISSRIKVPDYNQFDLENDDLGVLRAKLTVTYEDYAKLEHEA